MPTYKLALYVSCGSKPVPGIKPGYCPSQMSDATLLPLNVNHTDSPLYHQTFSIFLQKLLGTSLTGSPTFKKMLKVKTT